MVIKIVDFGKRFEVAQSSPVKNLTWVPMPNRIQTNGREALNEIPPPEGISQEVFALSCLGVWLGIVQLASQKSKPRTGVIDMSINALSRALCLEREGIPFLQACLNALCNQRVGWIMIADSESAHSALIVNYELEESRVEESRRDSGTHNSTVLVTDARASTSDLCVLSGPGAPTEPSDNRSDLTVATRSQPVPSQEAGKNGKANTGDSKTDSEVGDLESFLVTLMGVYPSKIKSGSTVSRLSLDQVAFTWWKAGGHARQQQTLENAKAYGRYCAATGQKVKFLSTWLDDGWQTDWAAEPLPAKKIGMESMAALGEQFAEKLKKKGIVV